MQPQTTPQPTVAPQTGATPVPQTTAPQTAPQPVSTSQTTQLDPVAVNMARAIKATETSGQSDPYTAVGKSGEYGAYQYTAPTWATDSQKYLGQSIPLQSATMAQQNQVAYSKIEDLKNQGYTPLQVASIWNSGKPDPTGNIGVNAEGANYNTPNYVNSVVTAYNQFKSGQTPTTPQPTDSTVGSQSSNSQPGLLSQLGSRVNSAGANISDIGSYLSGNGSTQNPLSDALQVGGAVGGAVGDVTNAALELIPGVKFLEGEIGQGVGSLAQTPTGQAIVSSLQSFSQAHPELSADIGAGFNIATAIPILDGLGVAKDLALGGIGRVLVNGAENGAADGLAVDIGKTAAGRASLDAGGRDLIMNNVIKPRLILDPSLITTDGAGVTRYSTKGIQDTIGGTLKGIDENQLQPILDKASQNQMIGQDMTTLKNKALAEVNADERIKASGLLPQARAQVEKKFAGWAEAYGQNVKLNVENIMKRGAGDFTNWGTPEASADKAIYRSLQRDIEDVANKNGFGEVHTINQKMGDLIKTSDIMEGLDGKKVTVPKAGFIKKGIRLGAKVAGGVLGEAAGNLLGIPIVGAAGGAAASSLAEGTAEKALSGGLLRNAILKRTGEDAVLPTLKTVGKKTAGLLGGALAQKGVNAR